MGAANALNRPPCKKSARGVVFLGGGYPRRLGELVMCFMQGLSMLPVGLPCSHSCSLAYFQPWAARLGRVREMKNRMSVSELSAVLGYPSSETVQGLRLWKAFIRLSPSQRSEVLALIEELASDPAPRPGGRVPTG